jgi:hypothetical protein
MQCNSLLPEESSLAGMHAYYGHMLMLMLMMQQ